MTDTMKTASQVLREVSPEERAELRDWFDQPGLWAERMSNLYRLVERIAVERMDAAWEQGWVARGNGHEVQANPYHPTPSRGDETTPGVGREGEEYRCPPCREGRHHACSEPGTCRCTINPDTGADERTD